VEILRTGAQVAKDKASPFAARLKELREATGYTQRDTAAHASVSVLTYIRWERGETEPSFTQLCALAELFGVQLNDFRPEE
jgi:transcriptional regulator with XRE-family HTH domain